MGCCQSGRQGEALAARPSNKDGSSDGAVTRDHVSQSLTAGNRAGNPSTAITATLCISGNRRDDNSSMEEIRRSYLQGQLKVDEGCPLTDRQLYGLTKSWKAINRNMTVTAINMFVR